MRICFAFWNVELLPSLPFFFVPIVVMRQELLDTTMSHLEAFALEGLRTLMVGSKEMTDEDYEEWEEVKKNCDISEIQKVLEIREIDILCYDL